MSTRNFLAAQGEQRRVVSGTLRAMGGGGIGAGDEFALVGYAALYNNLSKNLGGFREKISPGTFNRSLKEGADVKALFNHAPDNILGRTKSGTLQLSQDDRGLKFRCQLNRESQAHRDLFESVKRGDIDECSFAFTVPSGGDMWAEGTDPDTGEACAMRTLKNVDLLDVSVVTYPAYDNTGVSARKFGYTKKESSAWKADLDKRATDSQVFAIATLRKAAQIMAKAILAEHKREMAPLDLNEAISGHLRIAHELAEASYAMSQSAADLFQPGGDSDKDFDEDSLRALRHTHELAHASVKLACDHFAKTRMAHGKMGTKSGKKK